MRTLTLCPRERIFLDGKEMTIKLSQEAQQDREIYNAMLYSCKCKNEPSAEEIKEWGKYNELFNNLNIDEIKNKYKVEFLEQEKPYQDYDW